ncbi:MAG: hypothetical protein ACJ74O_14210 [Frankiaceae bacterium]
MLVTVHAPGQIPTARSGAKPPAVAGRGYVLEDGPQGRTLVVTGRWSGAIERALRRPDVDGLALEAARGFTDGHLDRLDADWGVRRLHVLDRAIADLRSIERLGGSLRELSVHAAPGAALNLGALPHLESVAGDWPILRGTLGSVAGLRTAMAWGFDEPTLADFGRHEGLESLAVKDSPSLTSLAGLTGVRGTLRELELESCEGIDSLGPVAELGCLEFLGVSDCGDIASVRPLRGLERLRALHAWGSTCIVDGDLSPLTTLPRLGEIRMRDRCRYRPRVADCVLGDPV